MELVTLVEGTPELRSCVKVEVPALGSPSLISLVVSVDVEQHRNENEGTDLTLAAQPYRNSKSALHFAVCPSDLLL